MKKSILVTTSMERTTRILLRTELFLLLKKEHHIIIASPAEASEEWKKEFIGEGVTFFKDYLSDDAIIADIIRDLHLSAVISCSNSDVPAHSFDVNIQKVCKSLNIPVIIVQDFIDSIFHPMVVKPDLYLCWGDFFKRIYSRKRDVMTWHPIGSLNGLAVEEALQNVKITGPCHFDTYRKSDFSLREKFTAELDLDKSRPIFTYMPNGEISQWVFDTFENFMETTREFNGQVIIKSHPMRIGDNWIYNLITKNYKDIIVRTLTDPSINKGSAFGLKTYDGNIYHLDSVDQWALGNILYNSDIVCSIPSTTALEAMIFNKPVVLETMYWSHPWETRRNVMHWYWSVLDSYKCSKRSKQYGDLFEYVEQSLRNPNELIEGRAHIVQDFFNGADGNSCLNTFNEIKAYLG